MRPEDSSIATEALLSATIDRIQVVRAAEDRVGALPLPYLKSKGLEALGLAHHLQRMCSVLSINHREARRRFFLQWCLRDRDIAAVSFERGMELFKHEKRQELLRRILERRHRWQVSIAFRSFRHSLRKWQDLSAMEECRRREIARQIQHRVMISWIRQRQAEKARSRRVERAAGVERTMNEAVCAVLNFEMSRRAILWESSNLQKQSSALELRDHCAGCIQNAWRNYKSRELLLQESIRWRTYYYAVRQRREQRLWSRWLHPVVDEAVQHVLRVSKMHAMAKVKCERCEIMLQEEAAAMARELECRRAASTIRAAWTAFSERQNYLVTLAAIRRIQAGFRHTLARRSLQQEIFGRINSTRRLAEKERLRIVALRNVNATVIQRWARKCLFQMALQRRFNRRRYLLEEERQNRHRLAACMMIASGSRLAMLQLMSRESWAALDAAINPTDYVAREKAKALALGIAMSDPLAYHCHKVEDEEHRAALVIFKAYWHSRGRRTLTLRFIAHKEKIEAERKRLLDLKLNGASKCISRSWKASKLRGEVTTRVKRKLDARRDVAARAVQKLFRHALWLHKLRDKFLVRRLLLAETKEHAKMVAAAGKIRAWYRRRMHMYNSPLRIVARYQIRLRMQKEEALYEHARRYRSALVVQRWWRKRQQRIYLLARFQNRFSRLEIAKDLKRREECALKLQVWYRKCIRQRLMHERFTSRGRRLRENREKAIRAALEERAAIRIQRCLRGSSRRAFMQVRFKLRAKALELERAMDARRVRELAEAEDVRKHQEEKMSAEKRDIEASLDLEKAAHARHQKAWTDKIFAAWALGHSDDKGGTFWYNRITDETTNTLPLGWTVKADERWERRENEKGQTYFVDLLSGERSWFAPCEQCKLEASTKKCVTSPCEGKLWCDKCWAKAHNRGQSGMGRHMVEKPPNGKDDLQAGEKHCIHCLWRRAEHFCRNCEDMVCLPCSKQIHSSGHRKHHTIITYEQYKKSWQTIEGRVEGEPTYYYHPMTGESVYDKPEELVSARLENSRLYFLHYVLTTHLAAYFLRCKRQSSGSTKRWDNSQDSSLHAWALTPPSLSCNKTPSIWNI
jgi:hypothetical protein